MQSMFRTRRLSSVLTAVFCIAAGAVLIAFPQDAVRWTCMALGALLLVAGVFNLVSFLRGGRLRSAFQFDLVVGIVLSIIGLWLLLRPDSVVALVQYIFGAMILIHGLIQMHAAISLRGGIAPILLSAVPVILGIVVIMDPFSSLAMLVVLIGIILLYNGIIDLYLIFRLSRVEAKVQAAAGEAAAEAEALGNVPFTEAPDSPDDPAEGP